MRRIKISLLLCLICSLVGVTNAATYYLKSGGLMTVLADWGTNTNGTGTNPISFSGAHTWNVHNNSTVFLSSVIGVSGTSTVNIGDGVNPIDFTLSGSGGFGGAGFTNLRINSGATFVLNRPLSVFWNTSKTSISTNTTFSFTPFCDAIPGDVYDDVVVNSLSSIPLVSSSTVNNITITNSTSLFLNSSTLTINGAILPDLGTFEGDQFGAALEFNGIGNCGTLNFSPGTETLSTLVCNMANSSSSITLSSDLTIDGGELLLSSGGVDLGGYSLTVENTSIYNCSSGFFIGSSNSGVNLNANTLIGDFNMHPSLNTLKFLNIYSNGNLLISNTLNILDSIKVDGVNVSSGGNLRLTSTSSLKARVAEISGGGSLTGNITVQTFIPGGVTDWSVLGASGVSGLTFNSWYGQIPMAIEGSPTGVTSVNGQYFESVQGWNESDVYGYDTTITVSSPIVTGRAYWIYVGTGLNTTSDIITSVSGAPVTGNQTLPLSSSIQNGFCLLANPYPSPISWDKVVAGNPGITTGAIYIYNADLGLTTSYVGNISSHVNGAKSTIPMGQGFYMQSLGNSPLVITESMKVSNNTGLDPLLKNSSNTDVLRLKLTDGIYSDETVIRFHNSATNGYDNNLDAIKVFDSPGYVGYPGTWSKRTSISTKSNNLDYSINSLPPAIYQNAQIPVLAKAYMTGQHTISVSGQNSLPSGTCLTLKDKLLNINHNLLTSDYIFNMSDTTSTPRFELQVCANLFLGIQNVTLQNSNEVVISRDDKGPFVNLNFENQKVANILVTNILGQVIFQKTTDIKSGRFYFDTEESVVIVKVQTTDGNWNKKMFLQN
jgi:hypothetical protein